MGSNVEQIHAGVSVKWFNLGRQSAMSSKTGRIYTLGSIRSILGVDPTGTYAHKTCAGESSGSSVPKLYTAYCLQWSPVYTHNTTNLVDSKSCKRSQTGRRHIQGDSIYTQFKKGQTKGQTWGRDWEGPWGLLGAAVVLLLHVEGELKELDAYGFCTSPNVSYASVKISLKNK